MVKLSHISQIEKKNIFEDATISAEMVNGAFGAVTDGVFACAADATKAIMQVEVGDDAGLDEYKIAKGSHVRVGDLAQLNGEDIEIYGVQLPDTIAVDDRLASKADGTLEVDASATAPYFKVTKKIYAGARFAGVEATVVAE